MFRGTTARTTLASLAVTLLTLLLFAPAETFTSAHTLGEATAKAQIGTTSSELPVRDETDTVLGSTSRRTQEHPLITGRAAVADTPGTPGAVDRRAPRPSRAHTTAALQVFRC
ncbi:hypothetical protein [Streptomyces broussonetiae]|uniref:hypothetical protein n=1 Tax=Streptomyces broussonetiae TaxID=2686304 RepID=UPI0035DC1DF3